MQQVNRLSVENLPPKGYYVSNDEKKEKFYKNESHIHKQGPLSGVKAGAHKLSNDFLTYFPKGFAGSKNSDFYEFLSLGMVPYVVGSATLIALYTAANGAFNMKDAAAGSKIGKSMAAGVVLYGIGKWCSQKLAHMGIHAMTGVNLDQLYINKKNELPEPGQEKGLVRTQYPGVYSSTEFPRIDLTAKDSEMNKGDIYAHDDEIAKKAGFKDKLAAPNQVVGEKVKQLKARTTALENIGKYIVAATGVALGSQKAFENIQLKQPKTIVTALTEGAKQLWKGTDKNAITKHFGKVLAIGSLVSTALTCLIPVIGFKTNPNTMKSKVDAKKEYEVG